MKLRLSYFLYAFIIAATSASTTTVWAQQTQPPFDSQTAGQSAGKSAAHVNGVMNVAEANSLPFEDSFTPTLEINESFSNVQGLSAIDSPDPSIELATEGQQCDACESNVVTAEHLFPEVKNVNFFGVDRESCCDEWAGLCACKSLKYGCSCGGLKASKGHFGIPWLKSKFGGEGCDYCNGGCCDESCADGCADGCSKGCGKKRRQRASCGCNDRAVPTSIFGRSLKGNCRQCGCCDSSDCGDGCPPQEGCESCK